MDCIRFSRARRTRWPTVPLEIASCTIRPGPLPRFSVTKENKVINARQSHRANSLGQAHLSVYKVSLNLRTVFFEFRPSFPFPGYIDYAQCLFSEASHSSMKTCTSDALPLIKSFLFTMSDLSQLRLMAKPLCGSVLQLLKQSWMLVSFLSSCRNYFKWTGNTGTCTTTNK